MPPYELAHRVGALDAERPEEQFRNVGEFLRGRLLELLPADWSFDGKRVLDFGCGAGRVLGRFSEEARVAEFHGCDIDAPSIAWLDQHLSPPFRVAVNGETPPLPYPDDHFDLIYGISVFTHLVETWSTWLLELRRVLSGNGLLILTTMGSARSEEMAGEPWDPDRIGMYVVAYGQSWDQGGPMVLHSEWWLKAHWGRAFEIDRYEPVRAPDVNDWLLMRSNDHPRTQAELERPEEGEPREQLAAEHGLARAREELTRTRSELSRTRAELERRRRHLDSIAASRSWRLTAPMRALAARFRRR